MPGPPEIEVNPPRERICVICAEGHAPHDGIRAYSEALVIALNQLDGVEASLAIYKRDGAWRAAARRATAVVLQYNPFSYGRWGFAPRLIADLASVRALSVMIHEAYVPILDWRSALMGAWQRLQLRGVLASASSIWVSIELFRGSLPRGQRAAAVHLPVGSNVPDARARRQEFRARAGVGAERLVVAIYGSWHPSRAMDHVAAAIDGLAERGLPPLVLNLGAEAPALTGLPVGVDVEHPGPLPADELAGWIAAADLLLVPFVDGASTRRGTVIAGLQQEVCVVSTVGAQTDRELRRATSPVLTPAGDVSAYAAAVSTLAREPELRAERAAAGRRLYDERYAWSVIARRLLETLRDAR